MYTEEMKNMILEHNLREFLKQENLKEFELVHLKDIPFVTRWCYVVTIWENKLYPKTRWHKGPVIEGISPILVNFASLDDKALVWNTLVDGCRTPGIVVTKDLRSKSEKSETINMSKKRRKRKKSNFHKNCFHSSEEGGHENECSSHSEEDDFVW